MKQEQVRFERGTFQLELKKRIDHYFATTGLARRDLPRMYLKTATIMIWMALSYGVLVFYATSWWAGTLAAISLGFAMAGAGFNIGHDGGHSAASRRKPINRVMAHAFDFMGGSSYIWRWKHNVMHHSYPNIVDLDDDINTGPLARLSPFQQRRAAHRFQQFYMFGILALLPFKWHFIDDYRALARGKIGNQRFPRPTGWALAALIAGKIFFAFWAIAVPLWVGHSVWAVVLFYFIGTSVLGITLGVVFQLAHCVEDARFVAAIDPRTHRIPAEFAVHQIETSVDFARDSWLVSWYLGGLNFQIEHHLFPQICHVHYPEMAKIVEAACRERGVRYSTHDKIGGAIASHYRWLRAMGRPSAPVAVVARSS